MSIAFWICMLVFWFLVLAVGFYVYLDVKGD